MRVCIWDTSGDVMLDESPGKHWSSTARGFLIRRGHTVVVNPQAEHIGDFDLVIVAHYSDVGRIPDDMCPRTAFVTKYPGFLDAGEIVAKGFLYIGDKPLTEIELRRCISQILSKKVN